MNQLLDEDMPCPICGGRWDCVMEIGGRSVVICGDCDAAIPEDEYRKRNIGGPAGKEERV